MFTLVLKGKWSIDYGPLHDGGRAGQAAVDDWVMKGHRVWL